ncbi:MAG: diacylglycerol/lipid kinase family protein [Bacteroidota bacterium]
MTNSENGLIPPKELYTTNYDNVPAFQNWLCIVNPNAGASSKRKLQKQFITYLKIQPHLTVIEWEDKNNFKPVEDSINTYDYIIAIGGDGTVNRIAQAISGTSKKLGIVPLGSGNGLARTLGISTNPFKAWKQLKNAKPFLIDVGMCNNNLFLCTSGIGFDAEVARLFSTSNQRGLFTYIKLILTLALKYKSKNIKIEINGTTFNSKVFMVTCCNAGQFGNNFYIAPDAKLNDGEFNLVIIPKFSIITLIKIIFSLSIKSVKSSSYIIRKTINTFNVYAESPILIHFDGEAKQEEISVEFKILPKHLYVLK